MVFKFVLRTRSNFDKVFAEALIIKFLFNVILELKELLHRQFFDLELQVLEMLFWRFQLIYLSKRLDPPFLLVFGSSLVIVGFYLLSLGGFLLVFLSISFVSVGNGISYPSLLATISSHGSGKIQGRIQGLTASSGSAASIVGLIVGGFIFNSVKAGVFLISAVIFGFVFLLGLKLEVQEEAHAKYTVHSDMGHKFLGSHSLWHLRHPRHDKEDDKITQ